MSRLLRMYNPVANACSVMVHICLKHPVLVVVLGLSATAAFLVPLTPNQTSVYNIESSPAFQEMIELLEKNLHLLKEAEAKFEEVKQHYLAKGNKTTGLTETLAQEVLNKLPECDFGLHQIMSSPELSEDFARLYFYDLVSRLGSVDKAYTYYLHQ